MYSLESCDSDACGLATSKSLVLPAASIVSIITCRLWNYDGFYGGSMQPYPRSPVDRICWFGWYVTTTSNKVTVPKYV